MQDDAKPLSTGDVARYCGVSRMTILSWIRQGKLKAYTTPGGHYRIRVMDFHGFLKEFDMPVDTPIGVEESKRILVVARDTPIVRAIMRELSALDEGYEIHVVPDSTDPIAAIMDSKPELVVVCATHMWAESLDLVQRIKGKLEGQSAPVLLLPMPIGGEPEDESLASTSSTVVSGQFLP